MPNDLYALTSENRNSMLEIDQKWINDLNSDAACRCGRVFQPEKILDIVIPKHLHNAEGVLASGQVQIFAVFDELLATLDKEEVSEAFLIRRLVTGSEKVENWSALIPRDKRKLSVQSYRQTVPPGTSTCAICGDDACFESSDFFLPDTHWPRNGHVFWANTSIIVSDRSLGKLKQASGFRKQYGVGIFPIERKRG